MISQVLKRWGKDELKEIVNFLWMQRANDIDDEVKARILALWGTILTHFEAAAELSPDDKELAALLSKLAIYVDTIDERSLGLLKLSARHSGAGYETPFFVEQLDRLADSSPRGAAEVYVEMLENGVFPDYDMTHITSFIEKVYSAGELDLGNTICNLYMDRGFERFREIFEIHN